MKKKLILTGTEVHCNVSGHKVNLKIRGNVVIPMKILSICFLLLVISGCKKRQLRIPDIPTEYIDFFALSRKDINDIPDEYIVQTKYINISPDSTDLLFGKINKIQILNHKIYFYDLLRTINTNVNK